MHALLRVVLGSGIRLPQVSEDARGVLGSLEVDDDEVDGQVQLHGLGVQAVAIEGHADQLAAEGAALVQPPALRGSADLAPVRQVHLSPRAELQPV